MKSQASQQFGARLLSIAGRVLIGYILFKAINVARASSLPLSNAELNTTRQQQVNEMNICTPDKIGEALSAIKQEASVSGNSESELAQLLFEHCTADFLAENSVGAKVKQVVDEWMGIDVSKAKINQLFWLNEISTQSPKPQNVGQEFIDQCEQMNRGYEDFRNTTEELAQMIDIQMSQGNDLTDDQQDFLSFTLYTKFCSSIAQWQNGQNQDLW